MCEKRGWEENIRAVLSGRPDTYQRLPVTFLWHARPQKEQQSSETEERQQDLGWTGQGGAKKGEGWIRTERCKERVSVPHDDVWWLCSRWIHVFDHRNIKDTCENCPLHYSLPTFPCLYLVLLLVAEKSEIENAFWFVHLQARQHIVLFTRKYIPVVCICIFKRTFVINIRRSFLSVLLNLSVQLILLGAVFGLDHVRPCRLHWEPLSCFSSLVLLT